MSSLEPGLLDALHERVLHMIGGLPTVVPPYTQLPSALVEAEFARGARLNVELFFDALTSGELPSAERLRPVVDLAVSRVREGVPLAQMLDTYRVAATYLWSEVDNSLAGPDRAVLLDMGPVMMQYVATVTSQVALACVEDVNDPLWEQRERRRAVADALLEGREPAWAQENAPIAASFLVVAFQVGDRANPLRLTTVRNNLERIPGAFLRLDSTGWMALIPDSARNAVARCLHVDDAHDRTELWIGAADADRHTDIPAAAVEARAVSGICRRMSRPELVTAARDVLLEFALATGPAAHRQLAPIVAQLAEQPALVETLNAFFDCEFNQLATARRLAVHRNTVTYRLANIATTTGFDPLRPREAMVLYAALLATASSD